MTDLTCYSVTVREPEGALVTYEIWALSLLAARQAGRTLGIGVERVERVAYR